MQLTLVALGLVAVAVALLSWNQDTAPLAGDPVAAEEPGGRPRDPNR